VTWTLNVDPRMLSEAFLSAISFPRSFSVTSNLGPSVCGEDRALSRDDRCRGRNVSRTTVAYRNRERFRRDEELLRRSALAGIDHHRLDPAPVAHRDDLALPRRDQPGTAEGATKFVSTVIVMTQGSDAQLCH
jgi:hypothetical protein